MKKLIFLTVVLVMLTGCDVKNFKYVVGDIVTIKIDGRKGMIAKQLYNHTYYVKVAVIDPRPVEIYGQIITKTYTLIKMHEMELEPHTLLLRDGEMEGEK